MQRLDLSAAILLTILGLDPNVQGKDAVRLDNIEGRHSSTGPGLALCCGPRSVGCGVRVAYCYFSQATD